jgi:hypothetical protein
MRLSTYFRAYRECQWQMRVAIGHRPQGSFGILSDQDDQARRYQRYERLARKLQRRLEQALSDVDDLVDRLHLRPLEPR